ncbi:MAG: hypothetical protein K2X27_28175 [Candidatus Obscuribacterales bacterium]|nr:hypothetical protein [Candidatus Obscuribacterales bacterium]
MNSYFLPRLNGEQKKKLEAAQISFYDFALGDQPGVIVQEESLETALALLELKIKSQSASPYEGVQATVLTNANVVPGADQVLSHSASAGLWKGKNKDGMKRVAERFFLPYIGRDLVVDNPRAVVKPLEDDKFHIHIYSAPLSKNAVKVPLSIYGVPSEAYGDGAWGPAQTGVSFCDGNYVVAELVGQSNLYIYHDLTKSGSASEEMLFALILQRVIAHLNSEQPAEQARELFIDELSICWTEQLSEAAAADANALQVKIREQKQEVKKLLRGAAAEELKLLRNEGFSSDEILGAEYDALLKVPKVIDVRVENGEIWVFTDLLFARDPRTGKMHEVGRFKILLSPANTYPRWFNLDRQVKSFAELPMQGVHMYNNGTACLGNTETIFASLFSQRQWDFAAQVAIEFAESVNQANNDRAGLGVHLWPEATADAIAQRDARAKVKAEQSAAQKEYRKLYIHACAQRVESMQRESLGEIASLRAQVEKAQTELVGALRLRALKLKLTQRKRICERKALQSEFEALLKLPKVSGLRVESGAVSIFTQPLYCSDPKSKTKHEIGRFQIKIYLDGRSDGVRWFNLSRQEDACHKKQQAPNVLASGRAYFSDIRESFPDLIAASAARTFRTECNMRET